MRAQSPPAAWMLKPSPGAWAVPVRCPSRVARGSRALPRRLHSPGSESRPEGLPIRPAIAPPPLAPAPAARSRWERRRRATQGWTSLSSPPGPGRSGLSWVHLFWTLPPKFFSIRYGWASARMWPAAASAESGADRLSGALQSAEGVKSGVRLSWVHLFWTLPPKFFSLQF